MKESIDSQTTRNLLISSTAISFSLFTGSLLVQLFYFEQPCTLCKVQRGFIILAFFASIFGLFLNQKNQLLYFIIATYLANASVAAYHFGVQMNFFQDLCYVPKINDIQQFKQLLKSQVGCSQIGFTVFGLPASAINALASLIVSLSLMLSCKPIVSSSQKY